MSSNLSHQIIDASSKNKSGLHVCFFVHSGDAEGGAERSLTSMVSQLIEDYSVHCTVVLATDGSLSKKLTSIGADVLIGHYGWACSVDGQTPPHELNRKILQDFAEVQNVLVPRIRALDPDVICTYSLSLPWGAVVAKSLGKPHVWSICEYGELDYGFTYPVPFTQAIKLVDQFSDFIFYCADDVRKKLHPGIADARYADIYRAIEIPESELESKVKLEPGKVHIGIFGRLYEGKRQEDVIKAFVKVKQKHSNCVLHIIGSPDGAYKDVLDEIVSTNKIQDSVVFHGFHHNPYPLMQAMDIHVVASRLEAFGRVIAEAMALGKPLVCSAEPKRDYLTHGESVLWFKNLDVDSLATQINLLVEDSALRAKLGRNAKISAANTFNRDKFSGRAYRVFVRLKEEFQQTPRSQGLESVFEAARSDRCEALSALCKGLSISLWPLLTSTDYVNAYQDVKKQLAEKDEIIEHQQLQNALLTATIESFNSAARHQNAFSNYSVTPALNAQTTSLFDKSFYQHRYQSELTGSSDPEKHFLEIGFAGGFAPNQFFDPWWYLAQYPDLIDQQQHPLIHFLQTGWKEKRKPHLFFDTNFYLQTHKDVADSGLNPLVHFIRHGHSENRQIHPTWKLSDIVSALSANNSAKRSAH